MRRAFTLLELMVVVTVLGVAFGLSALAWRAGRETPASIAVRGLDSARTRAVDEGHRTAWTDSVVTVFFWPDGSSTGGTIAVAGATLIVDPLSGGVHAQR